MQRSVSILIPTYNRCDILARTLESLSRIRVPDRVAADVIVVANACTDATEAVVAAAAPGMPMPARCVVETEPGLSAARNRAASEAKGDILAFLDDDVWVEPHWLEGLCEVYNKYPADVVGGRVLLWWEAVRQPAWMSKDFEIMLSGSDHGEDVFEIGTTGRFYMVGANFSFTRQTLLRTGRFRCGLGRSGSSLLAGEETEFLQRARAAGLRFFYAPRACVKHWVAPNRITNRYLNRLAFDFGRTSVFLTPAKSKWRWWPTVLGQPLRAPVNFAGSLVALLAGNESTALLRRLGGIQRCGQAAGALQVILSRASARPAA